MANQLRIIGNATDGFKIQKRKSILGFTLFGWSSYGHWELPYREGEHTPLVFSSSAEAADKIRKNRKVFRTKKGALVPIVEAITV